jgi:hypothetical protein
MGTILTTITYVTAVALALFSGGVSMYGLMKFAPGAELVIAVMALLFEAGKLTAFAVLHRRLPVLLKAALLVVGLVLMTLNIVGVSGFLSHAYEREQVAARASSHSAETEAAANVALLERQMKDAVEGISKANDSLAKAKGDRDQIRAIKDRIAVITAERDRFARELSAALGKKAKAEGSSIAASAEFAAIAFIAAASGINQDRVAHIFILGIASLPDILAVLLLVAAGYGHTATIPQAAVRQARDPASEPAGETPAAAKPAPVPAMAKSALAEVPPAEPEVDAPAMTPQPEPNSDVVVLTKGQYRSDTSAAEIFLGLGRLLYDDGHDDWQAVYAEELGITTKRLTDIRKGKADLNRAGAKNALLVDALRLAEREAQAAERRSKQIRAFLKKTASTV